MGKPELSDWKRGKGEPWDDPVWSHNARTIQAKLDALLEEAHRAGVQIEMAQVDSDDTVEIVELDSPPRDTDRWLDGYYLVANPDLDREPQLVLDSPEGNK